MKRLLLSLAITATILTSCDMHMADVEKTRTDSDSTAIGFGVYVNRGVTSKAGKTGELTTATLQEADGGFGVFGFYGNGALYNESSKPDFMYNEKVTYVSGKWDYHPIKYWPNEFGAAASSEAADRLTFFAYAPYVEVTPLTGVVTATGDAATTGIIGLSRNIASGDPMAMYSASLTPGSGVDLCWGVAAADFSSSVDGNNNHVDKGSPFIDLIKPKTGDRLTFEFNHALAQLNVQVDADIDVESHNTSSLAAQTHIYVRSVTFNGFTLRGSLNLNSNTSNGPAWFDLSGIGYLKRDPVTIHDGRTEGLEAIAQDVNEVPAGLHPDIIQNGTSQGVTNTAVNLFNSTQADAPILVIPTSGVPVKVTIVYDIETADPSLPGYLSDGVTRGISVENTITKSIQLTGGGNMTLQAGKKYVIGLHLGLTSVKFDAKVTDWDNTSYANADLPVNTTTGTTPTTSSLFRGYDVSKGILMRTDNGTEVTYSLTDGSNQFEVLDYYANDESKNKYYFQWTSLQSELGQDADGNIKSDSDKLPDGWTFPGAGDPPYGDGTGWHQIIFGSATNITVNSQSVDYGYALVTVSKGTLNIPALLLVPDETDIDLTSLTGLENYFNEEDGDYGFDKIVLSSDDYDYLISKNCRFLPVTGYYSTAFEWRDGLGDYYPIGYYWCNDYQEKDNNSVYFLQVEYDSEWVAISQGINTEYYPVRLVKKMN